MQLKNLEYLVALARARHFARAAAACGVTQPTLSAGIKQLEEDMQLLIVERGQRFEGLTPEGERVLTWAYRILSDFESLMQEVSELRGGLVGRLRIGVVPVMLPVIALLTGPFAERYPRVNITVLSLSSVDIQHGLDVFELDVGLTYLDNEPLARVRALPLYREQYLVLTPTKGPFGRRERVTWREAASLPLCLLTPDMQNRRIIDAHFREAGVEPKPAIEANSIVALLSQLRRGGWSAVMPHSILYSMGALPGVKALPLVEPDVSHTLGVIVSDREPLRPVARAMLEVAESVDVEGVLARETGFRRGEVKAESGTAKAESGKREVPHGTRG